MKYIILLLISTNTLAIEQVKGFQKKNGTYVYPHTRKDKGMNKHTDPKKVKIPYRIK